MKRLALASLAIGLALAFAATASAQAPRRTATDDGERTYVIVEITGLDVNCSSLPSQTDVNSRIVELQKENGERMKANKAIDDEIKKLTSQMTVKKRELTAAKEDADKENLQKEIDDLKAQIDQKKMEIKPLTTWQAPKRFSKRDDADKYVEQVYKLSEAAKEKAAKKEEAKKK